MDSSKIENFPTGDTKLVEVSSNGEFVMLVSQTPSNIAIQACYMSEPTRSFCGKASLVDKPEAGIKVRVSKLYKSSQITLFMVNSDLFIQRRFNLDLSNDVTLLLTPTEELVEMDLGKEVGKDFFNNLEAYDLGKTSILVGNDSKGIPHILRIWGDYQNYYDFKTVFT